MSGESRPERRARPRRRALVVDDDSAMRALVKDLLEWEGIEARELPSGEGLVEAVEQEDVSLVVLDKEMPGTSGLDLVPYVSRRAPGSAGDRHHGVRGIEGAGRGDASRGDGISGQALSRRRFPAGDSRRSGSCPPGPGNPEPARVEMTRWFMDQA